MKSNNEKGNQKLFTVGTFISLSHDTSSLHGAKKHSVDGDGQLRTSKSTSISPSGFTNTFDGILSFGLAKRKKKQQKKDYQNGSSPELFCLPGTLTGSTNCLCRWPLSANSVNSPKSSEVMLLISNEIN